MLLLISMTRMKTLRNIIYGNSRSGDVGSVGGGDRRDDAAGDYADSLMKSLKQIMWFHVRQWLIG